MRDGKSKVTSKAKGGALDRAKRFMSGYYNGARF